MIRTLPAVAALALLAAPLVAQVGLASSARTVVLTATKPGFVSVALPSGNSASLPGSLGAGPNDFAPLPIETSWDLDPWSSSAVALVAYFTGGTIEAGTTTAGVAGATLVLFTQPVPAPAAAGTRLDQLQMRIDLGGRPELPPGTYQGTLNLLAITQ
jgi:hypothetical protein